jgi:hypothetical protein
MKTTPNLYKEDDTYGYYGKGLWYEFSMTFPGLADEIPKLERMMSPYTSDPILDSSSNHIEHKWYRIACLLGMAAWPEEQP